MTVHCGACGFHGLCDSVEWAMHLWRRCVVKSLPRWTPADWGITPK